jgi:hypothetical protein
VNQKLKNFGRGANFGLPGWLDDMNLTAYNTPYTSKNFHDT